VFQAAQHTDGTQGILFQLAVRDCDAVADTGTAHLFTGQNRFEHHLRRQAQLFCGQFTDDFQRTFFALAVNRTAGTFLVKDIAQLKSGIVVHHNFT
jgi:hypothetical protein